MWEQCRCSLLRNTNSLHCLHMYHLAAFKPPLFLWVLPQYQPLQGNPTTSCFTNFCHQIPHKMQGSLCLTRWYVSCQMFFTSWLVLCNPLIHAVMLNQHSCTDNDIPNLALDSNDPTDTLSETFEWQQPPGNSVNFTLYWSIHMSSLEP